jgi:hypothetical protein
LSGTQKVSLFVGKSFTRCPQKPVFHSDSLFWNWKEFLAGNLRSIGNLAGFWAILIKCDVLDQAELFYKKNILDLQWLGFNDSTTQGIFFSLS